jgi:hypothetical protein
MPAACSGQPSCKLPAVKDAMRRPGCLPLLYLSGTSGTSAESGIWWLRTLELQRAGILEGDVLAALATRAWVYGAPVSLFLIQFLSDLFGFVGSKEVSFQLITLGFSFFARCEAVSQEPLSLQSLRAIAYRILFELVQVEHF